MARRPYAPMGLALSACCAVLVGCGPAEKPKAIAPSKAELTAHEAELLRLTLTPDAERRLGLQSVPVGEGAGRTVRTAHGEVVAAPLAGGLPVAAGADLNAAALRTSPNAIELWAGPLGRRWSQRLGGAPDR